FAHRHRVPGQVGDQVLKVLGGMNTGVVGQVNERAVVVAQTHPVPPASFSGSGPVTPNPAGKWPGSPFPPRLTGVKASPVRLIHPLRGHACGQTRAQSGPTSLYAV